MTMTTTNPRSRARRRRRTAITTMSTTAVLLLAVSCLCNHNSLVQGFSAFSSRRPSSLSSLPFRVSDRSTPLTMRRGLFGVARRLSAKENDDDDEDAMMFFMNSEEEEETASLKDETEEAVQEEEVLMEEDIVSETSEFTVEDDDDDDDYQDGDYQDEETEADYESYNTSEKQQQQEEEDEWDEEEDGRFYELQDDGSDPNYTKQRELVEASVAARQQQQAEEAFDAVQHILDGELTEEEMKELDDLPISKQVEEITKNMQLVEEDVDWTNLERDVRQVDDIMEDPYPVHDGDDDEEEENLLEQDIAITDKDMVELQNAWKKTQDVQHMEPWDRVMAKNEMSDAWDHVSNETLQEMDDCLEEIGGSAYNVTRWLLYDLDFNVTNLILSAVKHNKAAPILFQHWYPQLLTYSRYQYTRDRNFDFTWHDVESADVSELERYYAGFGYDEIPTKLPGETGIISLEDLDEEEIKMAAFENWMTEVYNPEWDRKDFDDNDLRDEDNVFSKYFVPPQHPDLPAYDDVKQDLAEWDEEMGDDADEREYKEFMGRDLKYEVVKDEEFEREFRGHLVVACTGDDADLEVAEKITSRMAKNFGKKVHVETRVIAHARDDDNVFEIWLESYEIDLLHSKKRASLNTKGWDGPVECDDNQIDWLVEQVGFLISDDARFSYRYEMASAD